MKPNPASKEMVQEMFDSIAPRYDFLNHFLSLGIDILWRKKAIRLLASSHPKKILDVATGTADFALEALSLKPEKVFGIDISEKMLEIGRIKTKNTIIELRSGDSTKIPFSDTNFDAITVGFGVRNFEDVAKGIREMYRVLKPGGTLVVLEFSKPSVFPVKQFYTFYFSVILPVLGRMISNHKTAYSYLPESVSRFPEGKEFLSMLEKEGFKETRLVPLTFGIASIYLGKKIK